MFDYRNNVKRILNQTTGDEKSLRNGLAAIKLILGMTDGDQAIPKEKKKSSIELDLNQVNMLLTSLTKLLRTPGDIQAKSTALSAIQKLTMTPQVDRKFRDNLIDLKKNVNLSKTSNEQVNQKIFEQALEKKEKPKKDYRKGKRYTVVRLLSGCDLVDDGNRIVYTMKESQIHSLNLKSGDIVEALPEENNPHYEAEILRIVGFRKLSKMEVDTISTFKYAVVQGRPGHLSISRNAQG